MHSRVRDLEQLEEHDPDERRRKLGNVVLALIAIGALAVALGVLIGKAAEGHAPGRDPLDHLDRVAAVAAAQQEADEESPSVAPQPTAARAGRNLSPAVEASQLTFERSLTEEEERPEVIAALAAAAREADELAAAPGASSARPEVETRAHPARRPPSPEPVQLSAPGGSLRLSDDAVDADDEDEADGEQRPALARVQPNVPAAVAAGAASKQLQLARKHDKLIADAMPPETSGLRAPLGKDGEYTLQVISYDSKPAAEAFASSLRARGHEAFVTAGEVAGRGRYYRVRLGPFKSKERAEEYRRQFETRERMNTIVIKRAKDLEQE
jgi:DedD protein